MLKTSYNKFFPTPSFLVPNSFGLDLSDESLKFVKLIRTSKGIKLAKYGEMKIPTGVIESGRIKDTKRLEDILSTWKRENKVDSVRVSVPEEQVYLFKLYLLKEGLKSVREAIELSLEEHIPVPAPEAVFDYEILTQDENSLELQITAISKNVIDNYLEILDHNNISLSAFELEAESIARAVVSRGDKETYMIVDFGEKRTGIFIISDGVVVFTSTLDFSGEMLNQAIVKSFKVNMEEAEKIKRQYGLKRDASNREVFPVLLNSVSILRDEVSKHLLYWQTHKDEKGKTNPLIKKIILCGGGSNLTGLTEYFSVSLKIPTELADVWQNINMVDKKIPEMTFRESLSFAPSLGLALGNFDYD